MANLDDEKLSAFLETLPTYLLYRKPEFKGELWVFSSKNDGFVSNSTSDDIGTRMMINDKIKYAFTKVKGISGLVVQFWTPMEIGGARLLSATGQPFAVSDLDRGLEYRHLIVDYECNIHVNDINGGPPASAFLNHFPEAFLLNTSVHKRGPLMGYSLEKPEMYTSFMLPIFCSSNRSSCIGVIECSSIWNRDLEFVNTMTMALEGEGMGVFTVQDRIPYEKLDVCKQIYTLVKQTIHGLKLATNDIQESLEEVCVTHNIVLAQVWIPYENENENDNCVPFSSSLGHTQTKPLLALKLTGYNSVNKNSERFSWRLTKYYDFCDKIPLKIGEGLVLKTLQNYEPHFFGSMPKLSTDKKMARASPSHDDYDDAIMGLVICLRNIDTRDFCYVFEFIWMHNSNYIFLLEDLLLTLKRCLPRFKLASGAELGHELHVIDVYNSTKSKIKSFKIFQRKRLSPMPESLEKGKEKLVVDYKAPSKAKRNTTEIQLSQEDIEQQYGKTMKEAAKTLGVSLSTLKRKCNDFGLLGWQGPELPKKRKPSHTNEKDNGAIHDPSPVSRNENTMTIKAEYADDIIKLRLCISEAKFVTVENEISKKLKLPVGTYKIKYLDEDEEWILMTSDQDMSDCIRSSRNVDRSAVRLRVLLHNQ
ncbi:NIN-like protein [Artemisia annua]|uniref:NIN-like protein n=1 Tax=Artemisia annua TaxID=35608 RepID=A0A2U1QIA8_ARTAN|nr:NIN-like protein [Artemisia annua]